jgi:type I restriction enzyme S subunit
MKNRNYKSWSEIQLIELLTTLETGGRPKGGVDGILDGIPSVGGEHLASDGKFNFSKIKYVPFEFANKLKRGLIKENDVLIVKDGATTGKVSFIDKTFPHSRAFVNEHVFICRPKNIVYPKFLFWYLWSKGGQDKILTNFKGSAQGGINQSFAFNTLIPLPLLSEQKSIVTKVDAVMAKVQSIREKLDRIPGILKKFRQSVLSAAVSGKLTEDWRERNGEVESVNKLKYKSLKNIIDDKASDYTLFEIPSKWRWKNISDIADVKGGKRLPPGHVLVNERTCFPYIKAGNLKKGTVQMDELAYLLPETQELIKRYIVSSGDVYITNVGACIGDAGIIPEEMNGANLTENALKICNLEHVNNMFLSFWLQSSIAQGFIKQTIFSGAQGKLALGRLQAFPIPLAPLKEQKEIVKGVKALFEIADSIQARYEQALENVDQLPQALLAKAFRGELVTGNIKMEEV